jgi:hypothetical protein
MEPQSNYKLRNRSLAVMALIAMSLVGFVAYRFATFRMFPDPPEAKPFDASVWKAPSSSDFDSDVRAAMLDDLLARHDFTGWSRSRLETLLGPADDTGLESRSVGAPANWDLGYRAGTDWIDFRVLVFDLDSNEKVASYQVELY